MKVRAFGYALSIGVTAALFAGCGTVGGSRLSPSARNPAEQGRVQPTYSVLYSFKGYPSDGQWPAALVNVGGTLYGPTVRGGRYRCYKIKGCGTVFSLTTSGIETVLHSFKGGDGSKPDSHLLDVNGTLYGTTAKGGASCDIIGGCGTVFSITPTGIETVLYAFKGYPDDGADPVGGLIVVNGTLYGTTAIGGSGSCTRGNQGSVGCGAAFAISSSGTETLLHSFGKTQSDGDFPNGLVDVGGSLYGTTVEGGRVNDGTVFAITTSGVERVLHHFSIDHPQRNGALPVAGLIDANGTLYGTTSAGGQYNEGTVYSITPSGAFAVLHSFSGLGDGAIPSAALLNANDTLYGTTEVGGANRDGTVFSITMSGLETVLYSFKGYPDDGMYPDASLTEANGTLYGTTEFGGTVSCTNDQREVVGCGTVFALSPGER
jgi:uncharacterized repeat protein (TIGR03803 family)